MTALVFSAAVVAATASPAAATTTSRAYACQVAQLSGKLFAAQYCTPSGGAPANGLITGSFTVTVAVFNGAPGIAQCAATDPLTNLSGYASQDSFSTQVIGLNCVRV
ncbi:hypothetical protein [Actinokineospora sp. NBRC 105648]|uniref:hypothetical protein n=1 Tax=Actinokineospora sp. NBRC 105648 TaxID=3032206 RepID=UPI00255529F9|nr:hypothetical protein [Actinokineospora sp. NBRC 105648]